MSALERTRAADPLLGTRHSVRLTADERSRLGMEMRETTMSASAHARSKKSWA